MTLKKAEGYWKLLAKLESSIDGENPAVHAALANMRIALSQKLSGRTLRSELARSFDVPLPLLHIALLLGCDENKIRELNAVADSFAIEGDILYV